jgi:hypothetical protein
MSFVSVHQQLGVPARAVWDLISQADGVDRWLPLIASCRIEGSGPGARRFCTTAHGHRIEETITVIDHATHVFQYRIARLDFLPIENVRATIHVAEAADGRCQALWLANYDLRDPGAAEAVRHGLAEAYASGLAGLERLAREAA